MTRWVGAADLHEAAKASNAVRDAAVSSGERILAHMLAVSQNIDIPDQQQMWDSWHSRHAAEGSWTDADGPLVAKFLDALPASELPIVDLGCGQATSALYDSTLGDRTGAIIGIDFSKRSIELAELRTRGRERNVRFSCADISKPLQIASASVRGAYAHLSLHYFDEGTTRQIVAEIERTLIPGGAFAIAVKSVRDKLYGLGDKVGQDYFVRKNHVRRFFNESTLLELLAQWQVLDVCEVRALDPDAEVASTILMAIAHKRSS